MSDSIDEKFYFYENFYTACTEIYYRNLSYFHTHARARVSSLLCSYVPKYPKIATPYHIVRIINLQN